MVYEKPNAEFVSFETESIMDAELGEGPSGIVDGLAELDD